MNKSPAGLTLLETLMGLAVLTISVLALVLLQQSTFAADATSSSSRTAQRFAENELTAQLATQGTTNATCITQSNIEQANLEDADPDSMYSCSVLISRCGITAQPPVQLNCSATAPNPPTHELITVTIAAPHAQDVTLTTLRPRH